MSEEEKKILKQMLYDYGNEGILKELALILREQADEQSDMGFKDKSDESASLANILIHIRSTLKLGRAKLASQL